MIGEDRKVAVLQARIRAWEDTDEEDQGEGYQEQFNCIASEARSIEPGFLSSDEDRDRLDNLLHLIEVYE